MGAAAATVQAEQLSQEKARPADDVCVASGAIRAMSLRPCDHCRSDLFDIAVAACRRGIAVGPRVPLPPWLWDILCPCSACLRRANGNTHLVCLTIIDTRSRHSEVHQISQLCDELLMETAIEYAGEKWRRRRRHLEALLATR